MSSLSSLRMVRVSLACFPLFLQLFFTECASSQVFGVRRPNVWYAQATPGISFFLGHTGIDGPTGTTVSDVLRWGASLTSTVGANARAFSMAIHSRMEYQESHSTGALPVKGPSILDIALRALYNLKSDSTTNFGMAFQGGCYTALLPETRGDGVTTRRFFDPAALYEGIFLSREDQFGRLNLLKTSLQLGYSMQQLVASKSDDQSVGGINPTENVGLTAFVAIDFLRQVTPSGEGQLASAFFFGVTVKGFKKDPGFDRWENARVEGGARLGFSLGSILEFLTAAEVVYDSDISPRRDLRTTVSIGLKYDLASTGLF